MSETSHGIEIAVPPAVGDPLCHGVQQILAAGHDDDGGAVPGELFGRGLADAGRCPGDQDALARQLDRFSRGPVEQRLR